MTKNDERERRLAEALRENLLKRKGRLRGDNPPRNGEGSQPKTGGGAPDEER